MKKNYICVEGPDGSGKTTLITKIRNWLDFKGIPAVFVQEPGTTTLGLQIREVLKTEPHSPFVQAVMMTTTRANLRPIIESHLAVDTVVVSDRCFWSTYAYQGMEVPDSTLDTLTDNAMGDCRPGLIFFLDMNFETCQERLSNRGETDKIEEGVNIRNPDAFETIIGKYRKLSNTYPGKSVNLDGTCTPDEVFEDVVIELEKYFA